jgi:hypothetical protein
VAISRSLAASYVLRVGGSNTTGSVISEAPFDENIRVFSRGASGPAVTNARLAFYSIGESLDLALLDARVTALITAFGVAIP